MAGKTLLAKVCVLARRAETEAHRALILFSQEHGLLTAHERVGKTRKTQALDLFDDAEVLLSSTNQGRTWFVQEARVLQRRDGIGRAYETLEHASAFTSLIARNPSPDEGREIVALLLARMLDALAGGTSHPGVVYLKALYSLARAEGHPVSHQWVGQLSEALQREARRMLHTPLEELPDGDKLGETAAVLRRSLERYLAGHTEMLVD